MGAQGVRYYSHITGPSSTHLMLQAARISSTTGDRTAAARRLFGLRFGEQPPPTVGLAQLRGMEGARMRATYKALASQHGIRFKRQYETDAWENTDPINQALNAANACLYGITAACLSALGVPHGLGIVHTGPRRSLVYDIADLYKSEITVPLAFKHAHHNGPNVDSAIRRHFRDTLVLTKLLPRIVRDIHFVLDPQATSAPHTEDAPSQLVSLWDPQQAVPGGTNYADPSGTEDW